MEEKKHIKLLSSNTDVHGNKVEATEEQLDVNRPATQHAKELVRQAAGIHTPLGGKHLGSAVVHFYAKTILGNRQDLFVVCQTDLEGVTDEQHASLGEKQLREAMMKRFGRKPPKVRK